MSGDQIYADDVAGPMLMAIHALIKKLGIFKEKPLGIEIPEEVDDLLYKRRDLLPTSADVGSKSRRLYKRSSTSSGISIPSGFSLKIPNFLISA